MFTSLFLVMFPGLVNYALQAAKSERVHVAGSQALSIAEGGIDKAAYELNQNANYSGETNTVVGNGTLNIAVATVDANTKRITATAYVPNSINPTATKIVKASVAIDSTIISFRFGVQVGEGGIVMNNGSQINGNLYSNGSISGGGTITGDATVAGGTQPTPDQSWTTQNSGTNVGDISARGSVAQSFRAGTSTTLNKVSLYLKKTGVPNNATVYITDDNGGKPATSALATGSLPASTVTGTYNFTDVSFVTAPSLVNGTTYWIVLVSPINTTNYYTWGLDTASGYPNGNPRSTTNWSSNSASWSAISGDLNFKTYMGGVITSISGVTVNGNAWAHSLSSCSIGGNATYQTISGCSVGGTQYPNSADSTPGTMPISDAQIIEWEDIALAGGTLAGPYSIPNNASQTLGPIKINGNLTVNGNLYVSGPIWVHGNVVFGVNSKLIVAGGTGNNGAVLIGDVPTASSTQGTIFLSNNMVVSGNGNPGSFPMVISTNTGANAITLNNNAAGIVLYAARGTLNISNNGGGSQLTAYRIILGNSSTINYVSGLQSASFSNGPGGSWQFVPGSYTVVR